MNKTFCRSLYTQYNDKGIQVAWDFLKQLGYEMVDRTESFSSHDFLVRKDNHVYAVEAEVSAVWKSRIFPYPTMSVPYRKRHSKADFYVRSNNNGTALFFLPMKDVHQAPVIYKDTCYTKNEPFFNVALEKLELYTLTETGEWVKNGSGVV